MIIHRMQQGSWAWFKARAGKVTGSELGNLITDKGQIRAWKTAAPNSYLNRKLAEKWRGEPLESFGGNRQTDQGKFCEGTARKHFASLLESDIQTIGGLESDDKRLWCSPDGLIGESCGLEIKCPNADTHVGWLLDGMQIPEEHRLQVQFGLYLTGWSSWHFLSYCKDLPSLAVQVWPDAELAQTITDALADFYIYFDLGWSRLCEINGGPPEPKPEFVPSSEPIKFTWQQSEEDPAQDALGIVP